MFRSTLYYLGIFTIFITIFSFLNILLCYYFDYLISIKVYVYTLLISLFISFFFIFFNKNYFRKKINLFEKLFFVIVGFFYFPLLISIPYYLSIYNINFVNSYFESISGFTSTGFTIFENTKDIDEPLLIWRSISQWLGGLFFLYSLFLLTGSKLNIKNIYSYYESVNLSEIKNQYTKVLFIYFILTTLIFVLITFSGVRLFEGLNLSMTIISSGGFLPTNNLDDIIRTDNQKLIISFCMLIPFFNLYLIYNIFSGNRSLHKNFEDLYLLILLMFVLTVAYVFNDNYAYISILFAIISSLSNIGIAFNQQLTNLSVMFLILVIIGGSSFSTSSGLKLIKIYALLKFSLREIYLIVKPLHVSNNTFPLSKNKINDEEINIYFLTIVFFLSSLFILSGILSFEEIGFKESLTMSILTVTNTVNSNNYNLEEFFFLDLNLFSKYSLILFMVFGRVEILSILILIKKFLFK